VVQLDGRHADRLRVEPTAAPSEAPEGSTPGRPASG
jgi:hypothetical protein